MPLVEFRHVTKLYKQLAAVSDLCFQIEENQSMGLVGESGCGKSTTESLLLGLLQPTKGTVYWEGKEISRLKREDRKAFRKNVQMVFQDTAASLNPRLRVFDSVAEPIRNFEALSKSELRERVARLLKLVGLPPSCMDQYPRSFSGGQRQRIAIARALALEPKLLILDEATSNLDVSIQAQILNLLKDLKEQSALSYLVISHDLGVIRHMCDRVIVMKDGAAVEVLEGGRLGDAVHPYTRLLLDSVPDVRNRVLQQES